MASRALFTLLGGQRLVDLPFSYDVGSNSLLVSLNGQTLVNGRDYAELSPTQIYLSDHAVAGETLETRTLELLP